MFERLINIERMETAVSLFGSFDENIKLIEQSFDVHIVIRGAELKIQGDVEQVMMAEKAVLSLLHLLQKDADTIVFSTQPLSDEDWRPVPFLRLQVYREGHLVYTGTHESQEYFDPVKDYEYRNFDYAHL